MLRSDALLDHAAVLAETHALRGYDSVQPAAATKSDRKFRKAEVRPWDWTNWGPPLGYGDRPGLHSMNEVTDNTAYVLR